MPRFAAVLDQHSPFEHHVLGYGEDSRLEHWTNPIVEPFLEFSANIHIGQKLDAKANFRQRDRAEEQALQRLRSDERDGRALDADLRRVLWISKYDRGKLGRAPVGAVNAV